MYVGVGSTNPVKAAATRSAFAGEVTVEAVSVESDVSEQPFGEAETIRGARTRARRVLDADEFDLGVGLEGGVMEVHEVAGLFLSMWAAATDGERMEIGSGPRVRLPDRVAVRIGAGEELGPVMDDLLGTSNVAENRGAAGALTGNAIDREEGLRHAVACALGPFVTDYY